VDLDLDLDGAALTARLVDMPSVSGDEGPIADAIEAALLPLPHLAVHRDGNTIVARTMLGRPERVLLAGHVDTVPVAGNLPSRLAGTRLLGCGTTDMKSGLAVQLRLAATVTAPARDVTYVFYDGEEVAAERNGLLRLSRRAPELLACDFAVLLEPTSVLIEAGCQGTLRAEITAAGQRAHTARSWMGRNAIHEAGAILDVLRGYTPREPEVEGLRYHEGLNAVAVRGGVAGNVVPDECVVTVNYRFAPDRDGNQAAEYLRSLFPAWPVTVLDVADGARPGLGHPAAAAFVAAVGGAPDAGPPPRAKLGWTDVARFAALGIPAVNYGPGISEIAHTPGEYVETAAIAECEVRLRAWLSLPCCRARAAGPCCRPVLPGPCCRPVLPARAARPVLPGPRCPARAAGPCCRALPGRAVAQPDRGRVPRAADAHPADRHHVARVVPGRDPGQ
jgi:succinyl-diaminopimelate desuccinylase